VTKKQGTSTFRRYSENNIIRNEVLQTTIILCYIHEGQIPSLATSFEQKVADLVTDLVRPGLRLFLLKTCSQS